MGEMAELLLASSDPYDEFERTGNGSGYSSGKSLDVGTLEEKYTTGAVINGHRFAITERASRYLMYIPVGSTVQIIYFTRNDEIYYICREKEE
jgi:hypothetical protein